MSAKEKGFELLGKGDFEGVRRLIGDEPDCAEARDGNGVSLLMHFYTAGRRIWRRRLPPERSLMGNTGKANSSLRVE
jgi:hypothetical protein